MIRRAIVTALVTALGVGCGGEGSEQASAPATTRAAAAATTEEMSPEQQWLSDFSAFLLDIEFATARMGSLSDPNTVLASQHARTRVGAGANMLSKCSDGLATEEAPSSELARLAELGEDACRHFERASEQIFVGLGKRNASRLRAALDDYRAGKKAYEQANALHEELRGGA